MDDEHEALPGTVQTAIAACSTALHEADEAAARLQSGVMDPEDTCRIFVQMYAEAVVRQVTRVRETRKKADARARAAKWIEDWSARDEADTFRAQWTEEHALIWAAHQLERWIRRLADERLQEAPPPDPVLANVRNALEHLDEAGFEGNVAVPGPGSRSLRALPNKRLAIAAGGRLAFGLIDVKELEDRALAVVRSIEDEFMAEAESWWVEMNSGR